MYVSKNLNLECKRNIHFEITIKLYNLKQNLLESDELQETYKVVLKML